MADYAQRVEERAPHIGLSIRAGGTTDGKFVEGKPVLSSLEYAESVDYVTKAGRGGMALAEAARDAGILPTEEASMDAAEIKKIVEAAVAEHTAPLREANTGLLARALKGDARELATRLLESITLPAQSKVRVIETVLSQALPVKDGAIDEAKLTEAVSAAAKTEGAYVASLTNAGQVHGLGVAPAAVQEAAQPKPEDIEAHKVKTFMRMGMSEAAAKTAAKGRAA